VFAPRYTGITKDKRARVGEADMRFARGWAAHDKQNEPYLKLPSMPQESYCANLSR
jgi:hypothetical protein